METHTCLHCHKSIVKVDGIWFHQQGAKKVSLRGFRGDLYRGCKLTATPIPQSSPAVDCIYPDSTMPPVG